MTWLNHVKIGRRLLIVFGILGAILLTVGTGALWSQRAMSQANRASLDELEISNLVGQFTSELFAVRLVLKRARSSSRGWRRRSRSAYRPSGSSS